MAPVPGKRSLNMDTLVIFVNCSISQPQIGYPPDPLVQYANFRTAGILCSHADFVIWFRFRTSLFTFSLTYIALIYLGFERDIVWFVGHGSSGFHVRG